MFANEVKDAELIFNDAWRAAEQRLGREKLHFPKEILFLGGAPGSGKGTNTDFIMRERGLTAPPVVMSSLLDSPACQAVKAAGGMVGDKEVVAALIDTLLDPVNATGVVVDGFPRTKVQAEVARLLYDNMEAVYLENRGIAGFSRPIFRIVVLFIDEMTSVERQMYRGKVAREHNEKVKASGIGEMVEERPTDFDTSLAQKRYKTFNELTYDALKALGDMFIYNVINAGGEPEAVEANIHQEMAYQSSLELEPDTLEVVQHLPLASQVTMHARQRLVQRLDGYMLGGEASAFKMRRVAEKLEAEVYPAIERHALAGRCSVISTSKLFYSEEQLQMAIDILTERGFKVSSEPLVRGVKFSVHWSSSSNINFDA
jgi:adenylate kinase